MNPEVEIKILDERLHTWGLPNYQTAMAAAIDLIACLDAPLEIAHKPRLCWCPRALPCT